MCAKGRLRREPRWRPLFTALLCAMLTLGGLRASWAVSSVQVEVRPAEGGLALAVRAPNAGSLDLRSFTLDDPPRLVFDLADAALAPGQLGVLPVATAGIAQVRVGQFQAEPSVVRLVVDLDAFPAPAWQWATGESSDEALIVLSGLGPVDLKPAAVKGIGENTLIRFPGAARLRRRAGTLEEPPRIYADLLGAELPEALCRQEFAEGLVREVRMGRQEAEEGKPVARIVVELRQDVPHVMYAEGLDLVVAVGPQPWAMPAPPYQAAGGLRGKRIVVDPGHGGKDIGAPALPGPPPQPPFEKDLTLDIGKRLAALCRSEGAEVTMTREDDTYVTLQRRAAIANELKADVFVSVHCNSHASPNALEGTSVYYDHAHSIELARLVQQEMVAALGTVDKHVRNANFAVIRRTRGPGVLVETAYINHEGDRERLMNPNFRERAARAILQGVMQFLSQNPEQGSP